MSSKSIGFCFGVSVECVGFFRRDAVAQRVLATTTCLGGWLAVTAGIVSKRPGAPAGFQARVGKIRREAQIGRAHV